MTQPTLFWFRRDLRLSDNPGLSAAVARGGPVVLVVICDPEMEALGAAPKWRLSEGIRVLAAALEARGSRLILRRGPALEVLKGLCAELNADAVHWNRLYDPTSIERDKGVKSGLQSAGISAESHAGHVLHEPWTVATGKGGFYRVYTPYWRAVRGRDIGAALPAPSALPAPQAWPESDALDIWGLGAAMNRGAPIVARYAQVGEASATARLHRFADEGIDRYSTARDQLAENGTSGLSDNLAVGEISARQCWHAGRRAMEAGSQGAETFLREVVWRDFAHHLVYHTPHLTTRNWREGWDRFPWAGDNEAAERWRRGLTGEPVIDAAMRQLYVTGTMHNRARMLVASYLTKHLMTDWRVGLRWFAECLIDWDPASNAMGWQWAAGSGPDASPYFRIFNPATQAEKFDSTGRYRKRWVAALSDTPGDEALAFFEAAPRQWALDPGAPYPEPLVDLKEGRARALAAYQTHRAPADAA